MMAKQVVAIEIDDARISELTADTGASPTYAASLDVPDVVELQVTPNIRTAMLEGDAVVDSIYSKVTHLTGQVQFRSIPLDVLGVMLGASVTSSGTTPNQTTVMSLGENAKGKWFKLEGRAVAVEGFDGDANGLKVSIYKCKLTDNITITLNGEWANITAGFTAVRTRSDKKLLDITAEETQSTLT